MISANIWNFEDSQLYELSSTACYDIHCCDVNTDVAFTYHVPDFTTDGIRLVLSSHASSLLINLCKVELYGGVILSGNDSVAGRTTNKESNVKASASFMCTLGFTDEILQRVKQ